MFSKTCGGRGSRGRFFGIDPAISIPGVSTGVGEEGGRGGWERRVGEEGGRGGCEYTVYVV
jgi:hypothetical protein